MDYKELKEMVLETLEDSVLLEKPDTLNEFTLARAVQKIENEKVPFAMITVSRGDLSRQINMERNQELKMTLREEGFSWVDMRGSGYKKGGPEGTAVIEDSVLVWDDPREDSLRTQNTLFEVVKSLAKEFDQDSFLYGGPDREGEGGESDFAIRLYTDEGAAIKDVWAGGEEEYSELKVVDKSEAEFWSMLGNKSVQFREMQDRWKQFKPKSRLEAIKKQYYLNLAENKLKKY